MDNEPPRPQNEQAERADGQRPNGEADQSASRDLWRYLSLGTQLTGTVALFVLLGWWLDSRFGWSPWGMCVLGLLGVAAGLYHFLKDAMR